VLIARVNADISQADFEIALREYLSNLENAYWDLYYAYRELDSKLDLRDRALDVLQAFDAAMGALDAEPYRVEQIREQYYRFEQDVQNALTGRRLDGTRSYNGSPGGTFRATPGVYLAERRLRLLMGVPSTDQRLIRPSESPCLASALFVWESAKGEALTRRPELDRQRFRIKRAEMELTASRNFLLPKLDAVGRYRFRGFGHDLLDEGYSPVDPTDPKQRFQNAWRDLSTGDFQEWQMGVELSIPIGYRQGSAAVTNAEYRLARERAVLHEQERQVIHDLGNSVAEVDRAYHVMKTAYDRRASASAYLAGMQSKIEAGRFDRLTLEQVLEAQRRFAEADSQYHQAVADYQIALKNVNFEKGSLLEYHNIVAVNASGAIETVPAMHASPTPANLPPMPVPAAEGESEG
jgi:outer membrane protein TolC